MINGNMPAMPVEVAISESGCQEVQTGNSTYMAMGLTKREHIAALCLQGILANSVYMCGEHNRVKMAIDHADTLLTELEKGGGE